MMQVFLSGMQGMIKRVGKQLVLLGMVYCLAILGALASTAAPAQAARWQMTGQSPNGLAQQYVDLDSLRGGGSVWTVDSYFTEQLTEGGQNRADYVTKYDCDRRLYKDIAADGTEGERWGDASADPLNQATMDFVCKTVTTNITQSLQKASVPAPDPFLQ